MKAELQKQLLAKYPEFFAHTKKKIYIGEKPMWDEVEELAKQKEIVEPIQFGFECGDGWYWLLDKLMSTIQHYCKDNKKPAINVTQIKEKFGGLSFYYNGGDDLIWGMVWFAEALSYQICEYCGTTENVGKTQGWFSTICASCRVKTPNRKDLTWVPNKESILTSKDLKDIDLANEEKGLN
jgi:hypothetical protein